MYGGTPGDSPRTYHPFELVLQRLRQRGCRVWERGFDRARAICPSHRDARPSLAVTRRDSKVLIKCFAGCRQDDLVQALGLRMADLFVRGSLPELPRRIVAEYEYVDRSGVHIAQKVRYEPKAFKWRHRNPLVHGGYSWGFNGTEPGLYGLLNGAGESVVYCVEGEKAVDFLRELGLPATCPPSGASRWDRAWSIDLLGVGCCEVIILPDADISGRKHAERVAADLYAVGGDRIRLKVVALPGLSAGADVVDWLMDGRTPDDLDGCVSGASYWAPDAAERARLERRRALTRERVRKHRQRKGIGGSSESTDV
jgi:putative DNA primase/helicase